MIGQLLLVNGVLLLVYMTGWFLIAKRRHRLDTVDMAWGGGFIVASWAVALQQPSARSLLIACLVTVWGARLSWHIARRNAKKPEDPRYIALSDKWRGNFWLRAYGSIFFTQGIVIWLVSLPAVVAAGAPLAGLMWLGLAGAGLWVAGFIYESLADKQLADFLKQGKQTADSTGSKGRVLDTGLWRWSRHPNYFGELMQWWAIGLIALQVSFGWLGLIGPLTLTILIAFVSGVPMIEKRKRQNPAYRQYMQRTPSPLVPWFARSSQPPGPQTQT